MTSTARASRPSRSASRFGLVTGSVVIGLATQDAATQTLAEPRLDELPFRAPVFHGDSLRADTEVLAKRDANRTDPTSSASSSAA